MNIKKIFMSVALLLLAVWFWWWANAGAKPTIAKTPPNFAWGVCTFSLTVSFNHFSSVLGSPGIQPSWSKVTCDPASQPLDMNNQGPYTFLCKVNSGDIGTLNVKVPADVVCYNNTGGQCTDKNDEASEDINVTCTSNTNTFDNPNNPNTTAWWWTLTCKKPWEEPVGGKCICVPKAGVCCGIKLNTTVPFIGKCIQMISSADEKILKDNNKRNISDETLQVTENTAFPRLMLWLTKILVTVILLASFLAIIVAGVMMAASGAKEEWYSQWTKIIGSVIAALALLGASGVILRLINPNFFG